MFERLRNMADNLRAMGLVRALRYRPGGGIEAPDRGTVTVSEAGATEAPKTTRKPKRGRGV